MTWPSQTEALQLWNSLPIAIRQILSPNSQMCYPLAMDITFRPLTTGELPPNLTDYYCGKPDQMRHCFAHLLICDIFGNIRMTCPANSSRDGEHFVIRNSAINMNFFEFFPLDSSFGIVVDGLLRGISPHLDSKLLHHISSIYFIIHLFIN